MILKISKSSILKSKKQWGLTLVEALVSLGIMIVSAVVILGVLSTSFYSISDLRNNFLASQIAHEQLENWVGQGYSWIVSQPASTVGSTSVSSLANGATQNTLFNWTMQHQPFVPGGVEQITIQVSWSQKSGGTYTSSVGLSALVSEGTGASYSGGSLPPAW